MRKNLWILGFALLAMWQCKPKENNSLSQKEMLRIVTACDKQFSIGIQTKDSLFLTNIYTDSAQYIQPQTKIIKGKKAILKDWNGFINLKERPIDLILNPVSVRGNKEIIYETGYGYTLLADSSKWNFNYVNVWLLQKDGSYKLDIDTFN